jgi:peptidoglycan/xylan/chitin deacetylase (PgdA/CDA1 family)
MPLGTPADPGITPQTTFDQQPTYIPSNMIIITLDDGPDGSGCPGMGDSTSCTVLDNEFFMTQGMKVDFFINTNNRCPVMPMTGCYSYVQQLFQAGHYIANHTVDHAHLAPGGGLGGTHCMDPTCVTNELAGVEMTVQMLTNGGTKNLTRFRAPYGEPYQSGDASDQALAEPVVAQFAVEVNWNFDSQDSNGMAWDGPSLFNNVVGIIQTPGKGSWGIMLVHAVYPWTTQMLPLLIPYLQKNGFQLATVEDVICWRFGKHSWEIIPNKVAN